MLIYILKSSSCLFIFLVFYKLVLEKESVHSFKRYYLLGTILLALAIPLFTFTTYVEPLRVATDLLNATSSEELELSSNSKLVYVNSVNPVNHWKTICYALYALGVLLFGIKFVINLRGIFCKISRNKKLKERRLTKVLVWDEVIPHTFFRYIFYNRKKYQAGEIPQEVLWHEEVHAKQRHSIDVLFIELLNILLWFNPLIYVAKNCIKLNHEFLADQGVLRRGVSPGFYQHIVLAFAINKLPSDLVNAFQFSFIKKRLTIMKTKTTKKRMVLKSLLLLPLLALTLLSFISKKVEVKPTETESVPNAIEEILPVVQDKGLTTLEEYNKLARQYKDYPAYDFVTKARDMYRMWELHEQLSASEKAKAEPYFRSTSVMNIIITNDGRYLKDDKEISIAALEVLFKQLTAEEMSQAYAFSDETDIGKYVRDKRARNMSPESLNHIYIHVQSEEFVHGKVVNTKTKHVPSEKLKKSGFRLVTPALLNPKLKTYVEELHTMFRKYGIKVDYP